MGRPSNADILSGQKYFDVGTEAAVIAASVNYPQSTAINAVLVDDGSTNVTLGWTDNAGVAHIVQVNVGAELGILSAEERPNVPPGHAHKPEKLEHPAHPEKPEHPEKHAKHERGEWPEHREPRH